MLGKKKKEEKAEVKTEEKKQNANTEPTIKVYKDVYTTSIYGKVGIVFRLEFRYDYRGVKITKADEKFVELKQIEEGNIDEVISDVIAWIEATTESMRQYFDRVTKILSKAYEMGFEAFQPIRRAEATEG